MNGLLSDVRYALRQLGKNPAFTAIAVLTLALGIGANTAMFSVVNSVLLRSLPYKDSPRIYRIWGALPSRGLSQLPVSEPEFLEYKKSRSFDHMGAFVTAALNLTKAGAPERVTATWASADALSAVSAETILGRVFSAEEDQRGHNQVVVLGHRLWQTHFGGDPGILGKSVTLNNESKTVIGVMRPGFNFPSAEVDVWAPLALDPASKNVGLHYLGVVGHLAPGVTLQPASAEMQSLADQVKLTYPDYYKDAAGYTAALVSLQEQTVGNIRPALLVLMGGVGFMLLICCANVANLLLARAAGRKKEIATRMALGASRVRLVHQLLTESLLMSLVGGAVGVLLAFLGVRVLAVSDFDLPRMHEVSIDGAVLLFTLVASLLTAVVFGLAPALRASRSDLTDSLKEGGRSGKESKADSRMRGSLVISEIAFSLVLVAGSGLMIGSFVRLLDVRLGFDPADVLTMQLSLPQSQYPEQRQVASFYRQIINRIDTLPGVKAAAFVNYLPMTEENATASFEAEGETLNSASAVADYRIIGPDYFRVMSMALMKGRTLTELDSQRPAAVVINQTMAHAFWPEEDAVGRRIRLKADAPWLTVVGVVADVKNHGPSRPTNPEMYFPHSDQLGLWADLRSMTLVVRSGSDPQEMANAIRREIRVMDSDLPVYKVQTMSRLTAASISETRFTMELLSFFGGLALILAAVGVYGVMSYSVVQRTHEIGIRKALGARPRDIATLFAKQGFTLALIGVTIGLCSALALARLMSRLLYGLSATDPATFIGVAVLLACVALAAAYIPARRAAKVDPMVALRYE
jgi:putative ABC transport system permease protein